MASRDRHILSRSWSSSVAGIWTMLGRSLPYSVLQFGSYSDETLDGRVRTADSHSREFSAALRATPTFGYHRPVYGRDAHPLRNCAEFRVVRPFRKLGQTASSEEECPVPNRLHVSRHVGKELCRDSPRHGFASGEELPIGSACGRGKIHPPSASMTTEGITILNHRRQKGQSIDSYMFVEILKRCSMQKDLISTRQVHDYIIQSKMQKQRYVATTLLNAYIKCGALHDARLVFDGLEKTDRNVITWTVMIGAYAKGGCGEEAYRLFLQMKLQGFEPNAITYMSILNASASVGAFEWVREVHSHARKAGLESDLRVGNALVHMYAKSGSIDDARLVFDRMENRNVITSTTMIRAYAESGSINEARLIFDRMEERNVITWTVMIAGLAQHGRGREALELFRKMNADSVEPDATIFAAVLSACCHAGLVDDGRRLFLSMTQDYGIEPDVVHYSCMVDLLGRAEHLEEAKMLIGDMPVEPNIVTWGALLGACRTHGNVELGEIAAKELLKLEPKKAGAYVLLSNIYAAAGKWEKVSLVRSMMQKRGVWKDPGCSWIEVDNKVHEFIVGDSSHPEAKAIYSELKTLTEQLKAKGYIPDTKLVLHNIDEEDKELALCSHSEKLAIAYGLLRVPRGKSILVKKNLRVCSDCHEATKLTSEVTGREIIVRDANRFHHFKDGLCSCGDYW